MGEWVKTQRKQKEDLSIEQVARLESIRGWSWNALDDKWEEGLLHLQEFANREKHSNVHGKYRTPDGYSLGQWVAVQRKNRQNMLVERVIQLEAVVGWKWDVLSHQWEEGFRYLAEFANREGHCKISRTYKAADGYRLGDWVGSQRAMKDSMPCEQRVRLETLSGWSWDIFSELWEEGFR